MRSDWTRRSHNDIWLDDGAFAWRNCLWEREVSKSGIQVEALGAFILFDRLLIVENFRFPFTISNKKKTADVHIKLSNRHETQTSNYDQSLESRKTDVWFLRNTSEYLNVSIANLFCQCFLWPCCSWNWCPINTFW